MGTRLPAQSLGAIGLALLVLFAAGAAAPEPAAAQVSVTGQWSTLPYLSPVNPIHVALLKNGKVLIVGGSENNQDNTVYKNAVWNPATGAFAQQTTPWDLFCNGMSFLPDGRVLMTGGNITYDPFLGPPYTTVFDPATEKFYRLEDMAGGRWYPSNAALDDGGTMVFGGLDASGGTNTSTEIYDVGGGWSPPYPAPFTPGWYPRLHLLINGKVFMSGPNAQSRTFTPATGNWASSGPTTKYGGERLYGSSVLLPVSPEEGYRPRVVIMGGDTHGATNTVEYIDLGAWPESWVSMPSMSVPRVNMNAVLLPNGKILALGGSTLFNDPGSAHLNAETFDPVAQTWTPSGTMKYHRLYHSTALLLPDATVWVAGSNPTRQTWIPQMEIYKPPYLFTASGAAAPRPTISSIPAVVGYGQTFTVGTPNASGISKVLLMRPGSNTHAFDMEQRLVYMSFTKGSGTLSVTAPTSAGAAPPGYYMLFLLDASGVPSVAKFIQLIPNPTNQPPTAAITNPGGNVSIAAGQSVTFAGTASDPDGSIALTSWIFPGGSPKKSNALNPGAVTFSTPGIYTVSLSVLDNLGRNNPSPPTVTVTVGGAAALGASIGSPAHGATVSGTVTVSMAASNIQGSPTQFVLKLDSATTLSTQSVASGSTATYAWNTAGVTNGTHTLNLTVTDGAGRTANAAVTITVSNGTGGGGGGGDTTPPAVSITTPPNGAWMGNGVKVGVTATDNADLATIKVWGAGASFATVTCGGTSCAGEVWFDTTGKPNGAYQLSAVAADGAGNTTTSATVTVNKNATSPVFPSGASGGGGGGGGDTTAPTVAMTAPASGATVSGTVTVSATASDNVGVSSVQFKLDGVNIGTADTAAPYAISWNTTTAANGTHTLTATAADAAGNPTTSAPVTVTVSNATGGGGGGGGDTTPPAVTITTPPNGAWMGNGVKVGVSASDNAGLASIKVWGAGTSFATVTCAGTTCAGEVWFDTTGKPNGAYELNAVAMDSAGNATTSATVTVNKNATSPVFASGAGPAGGGGGGETTPTTGGGGGDTTSPTVSITTPPNGAWMGNGVKVGVTASGNAGLASIKVWGAGASFATVTCAGTACAGEVWFDTTGKPNGAYQLNAVATDSDGKTTTSATVTVNKNATSPVFPSGAP